MKNGYNGRPERNVKTEETLPPPGKFSKKPAPAWKNFLRAFTTVSIVDVNTESDHQNERLTPQNSYCYSSVQTETQSVTTSYEKTSNLLTTYRPLLVTSAV